MRHLTQSYLTFQIAVAAAIGVGGGELREGVRLHRLGPRLRNKMMEPRRGQVNILSL